MSKAGIILSLSLMLFVSTSVVADDSVPVRIYNDDADDIVLSVYDMNAQPPGAVVANQRVSGFAWIPTSVTAGALGNGHLKWIARTADPRFRRCGHREVHSVKNDALVHVSLNSSCRHITR